MVNDPVNYVDPFGLTASDSKVSVESNVSNDSSTVTTVAQTDASTTTTATTATQTEATPTATTQTISFAYTPSVSMPSNSAPSVSTGFMARPSIQKNTNSDGGKPFDNETVLTTSFNSV